MKNKLGKKTKEELIEEILERSVDSIYPSKEKLKEVLLSGKKLRVYIGADATGPDLHLGHATNYMLLEKFRKLGHEVIALFGDFTAMIGDPTGNDATRVPLTKKQVEKNIKTWKKQLKPILPFSFWNNNLKIVKNSKWLSAMNFEDVLSLTSKFTISQMLERDMFQKRIKEGKPIHIHEFLYPLMQGYDSVALDVDIEIGGTDQTFNMLTGRVLQRQINNKEKFVITTTLLVNPKTGQKLMSKSKGNYISLQESPSDMFGKIMALPDEIIIPMFVDCTYVPKEEIEELKKKLESGENPKNIKMKLAKEVVSIFHGENLAKRMENNFIKTFSEKKIPENIKEIVFSESILLSDVLLKEGLISSKGEYGRLLKEGAILNLDTKEKVLGLKEIAKRGIYKIGKHRFIRIK